MQVLFSGGNVAGNSAVKKLKKKSSALQNPSEKKDQVLSFMSIPSLAFKGKLVIPVLPESLVSKPQIDLNPAIKPKKLVPSKEPVVKYKVFPQDPLVTSTELYQMEGTVGIGPENNRVKISGRNKSTKPDADGNFIFDDKSKEFDRTNAFLFVNKALKLYEKSLGRKIYWAFGDNQIKVDTRAGKKINASYNRFDEEIKLYYDKSPSNPKEMLYTAKMADVITHEAGHAILDGLRPSYMGWGKPHGRAVHESFADCTSMLVAMSNDNILDRVIDDTGGNLRKENLIASLAEQLGKAVYKDRMYLRNAINGLKLSHFTSGKVEGESHIVGMFFDAVFYDILTDIYKLHCETLTPKEAIRKTRDEMTQLFTRAMGDFMPPGNVDFMDMFVALIQANKTDFKGKYTKLIADVLVRREILSDDKKKEEATNDKKVPAVSLPFNTNSLSRSKIGLNPIKVTPETIEKFVRDNKQLLELPQNNNYKLESAYTNSFGETFLQLKAGQKVDIPTVDGNKYSIEVLDGLTLGFDKNGNLFYKGINNTTQDEINGAIEDCLNNLKLVKQEQDKNLKPAIPRLFKTAQGSQLLVKAPILEDEPHKIPDSLN